jgi:hypothetical protein
LLCVESGSVASQMQASPCGGCAVAVPVALNSVCRTSSKQVVL